MVERICPSCQYGNPLDDRFCGKCGAELERQLPIRLGESRLTVAGRDFPHLSIGSVFRAGGLPVRFAGELDPSIVQLHSLDYRNPSQLREGDVLVVGAGNSGSEIALELARAGHKVWLSGRSTGEIPFRISGLAARLLLIRLVLRFLFHRVLTTDTPIGRKARPKVISKGGPLIRVKARDLAAAGVEWVPRTAGVRNGQPVLEDDRVLDVANVIWCTGFNPGFSWIDLPVTMDLHGGPLMHHRGVVASEPGLYFVGLHFLYAMSSTMIHGVSRDAEYIAETVAERVRARVVEEPRMPALLAAG